MEIEPISLYSAVVSTLALLFAFFLSRKKFKVKWEPIIHLIPILRNYCISSVNSREYCIRLTLNSKRGNVIVYSIENFSQFQEEGSQITIRNALTNELIDDQNGHVLRVEEGLPIHLLICFGLPDDIDIPFQERTGLLISTSAKNIRKPFTVRWS